MSASALELIDVETYYGESQVLWGVSIRVAPGSVVGILGRNGMGKTTILHSVIGFTPPRRGKVIFKGEEVTSRASPDREERHCARPAGTADSSHRSR